MSISTTALTDRYEGSPVVTFWVMLMLVGWTLGNQAAEREAECRVGTLHDGRRLRRSLQQRGAHANVLRSLAGKDERVRAR